jgi:mRNA interferase HigB
MELRGVDILMTYCDSHADLRTSADRWRRAVESTTWRNPHDVKGVFGSASILSDNRVVFNLKGNKYRLLAKIDFENQRVRIQRVGTHAEYSKWKL